MKWMNQLGTTDNLSSPFFFCLEGLGLFADVHGWGRLGEYGSDPCVGAAALGMETRRTERIRGAHGESGLEILLAAWLLLLQLMGSAVEDSWVQFSRWGKRPLCGAASLGTWSCLAM